MTQIIVSGETIINDQPDDSVYEVAGGVPTGLVTRGDGSSFTIGDLHNHAGPIELHQEVSLPDPSPAARPYLRWNGSAVVPGPDYPTYQAQKAAAARSVLQSDFDALVAGGLTITSTGTPALNGTYPVDVVSQAKMTSVAAYINANDKFPAGLSAMPIPLLSGGAVIATSTAAYVAVVSAIADFVTTADLALDTGSGRWPAASVTIP